jgi:pSer/pThr/pTyr-binding forkhead associated (FHA) protein
MHVRLKVLRGSNAGKEIPVPSPKCLIGRGDDCHLRPQVDAISRHHCEIITTENEVIVRDLKSRNGTFVNGDQVNGEAVLLAGDTLRVGPIEFEALIEQSVAKPKRPKVADIKEAVARTAQGGSTIAANRELGEVWQWLEEGDTEDKRKHNDPETRQFRIDDTSPPGEGNTKSVAAHDTKALPPDPKKSDKKQPPGKLPPRPTTSKENSREAAADMLKKFFNRR